MTGSIEMAETGSNLAMRALGYGTLLAIAGTGTLAFALWKLSGAKDVIFYFDNISDNVKEISFISATRLQK